MASPGRISVSGWGDIMLQVREFIKDMKYRNRQEEALGELEIARKRIELEASVLSAPAVDYMAAQLLLEYKPIKQLEEGGKLLPATSYEAHYERFIRSLDSKAAQAKELRPLRRRATGLSKPDARGWQKRMERLQAELRDLMRAGKVDEDSYDELHTNLRALGKARRSKG
jgi:hypothetical protein